MKKNPKFSVSDGAELLPFLLEHLGGQSRNNVKGLLRRGQITVDGKVCTDYARALRPGQAVEVLLSTPHSNYKMDIPIIYEDDEIIVIDKPAGILAVSTDRERENTAYHVVTGYVKHCDKSARVFIVHRLDRDTSGIMLFAKNERIKRALQDNWDSLTHHRGYIAVVEGRVTPPQGTVTSWLKETKTLMVYSSKKSGDGKKAVTNYQTTQVSDNYTLLSVSLETGRRNQIRVHLSDIGNPVAGDKKYGARTNPLGRLGLHSSKLVITHPFTEKQMCFESKLPNAFAKVMKKGTNNDR